MPLSASQHIFAVLMRTRDQSLSSLSMSGHLSLAITGLMFAHVHDHSPPHTRVIGQPAWRRSQGVAELGYDLLPAPIWAFGASPSRCSSSTSSTLYSRFLSFAASVIRGRDLRRRGDVRIGEPPGPVLRISSRFLFVHHVAHLAERLVATTGHFFEDMMTTCLPTALEELWRGHNTWRCGHIMASSVLQ